MTQSFVGLLIIYAGAYITYIFTIKAVIPECRAGYIEVLIPAAFVYAMLLALIAVGFFVFNHTP